MIEVINSKDLKTDTDLVCTHCGKEHGTIMNGKNISKEGIDYVFEKDTESEEEWCICIKCKRKCDDENINIIGKTRRFNRLGDNYR